MLKQRIKDGYVVTKEGNKKSAGNNIGMLVGEKINGKIQIGYSKVHSVMDEYDDEIAFLIARGRMKKADYDNVPPSITNDYIMFAERCESYYKDAKLSENVRHNIDSLKNNNNRFEIKKKLINDERTKQ